MPPPNSRAFSFKPVRVALAVAVTLFCFIPVALHGVAVVDPAGTPATPTPADFPLANLIGHQNSSAIYLGDIAGNGTYWAISSAHAGSPANLRINGITYNPIDSHRLSNNDLGIPGLSGNADLYLLQLDPMHLPIGATTLHIAEFMPGLNEDIYLLGYGRPTAGDWNSGNRWGMTKLDLTFPDFEGSLSGVLENTYVFSTLTNTAELLPAYAGWGIRYDSGGGALYYDTVTNQWLLLGTMLYVATGETHNFTFPAVLPYYHDQIYELAAAAIPEPGIYTLVGLTALGFLLKHRSKRSKKHL